MLAHKPEVPRPLVLSCDAPLAGSITVPGDKSISHRALMLAGLAVGQSRIDGLLEGEDVLATAAAMRAMGATIARTDDGCWQVDGVGVGALMSPPAHLDMGNSGTSTRLLAGLIASHPIAATLVGDASLSRRPMARITKPLGLAGAAFDTAPGGRLPMRIRGLCPALPIHWRMTVASAQVKSAILLAGLNTPGDTVVEEPEPTRDHTERMLAAFGADIQVETMDGGGHRIRLRGPAELRPQDITVPGDPSSAAFPAVAALIVPRSSIVIGGVGLNPTRDGLYRVLEKMGAHIERRNLRSIGGEPVADLHVQASDLRGIAVPADMAPAMIDEYPILFVAAAMAHGRTEMRGIGELRVKESDRIATMATGLKAAGVMVDELPDGLIITGSGGRRPPGGVTVATHMDHRIAMSFAILSLVTDTPVTVDDRAPINTSFPDFLRLMTGLGASAADQAE